MESTVQDDYKKVMREFIEGQSIILMNLIEKASKIEDPIERELALAKVNGMKTMYVCFFAANQYANGTDLDTVTKYLNEAVSED